MTDTRTGNNIRRKQLAGRPWPACFLAALAMLACCACSGGGGEPEATQAQIRQPAPLLQDTSLPGIPLGDADRPQRESLVAQQEKLDGIQSFARSFGNTVESGNNLILSFSPDSAWAIYQWNIATPDTTLLRLSCNCSGLQGDRYYTALANYATRRWEFSGPHQFAQPNIPYGSTADYTSPNGNVYAAVLTGPDDAASILSMILHIDRPLEELPAPSGLTASQGTHSDRIVLGWQGVEGAEGYRVYRDSADNLLVDIPDGNTTAHQDLLAADFSIHQYWVSAYDSQQESVASGPASGFAFQERGWWTLGGSGPRGGRSNQAGPTTGNLRWRWNTSISPFGDIRSSVVQGSDGTLYTNMDGGYLNAIKPDGTTKWQKSFVSIHGSYSTPTIAEDGKIYIVGNEFENGFLFAISDNGNSADIDWSYEADEQSASTPAIAADGTIYFGSNDGKLHAVNPDGSGKWTYDLSNIDVKVQAGPTVAADGTIYVGSFDGELHAVNPDGSGKWVFETGLIIRAPVSIGNGGVIYVTNSSDNDTEMKHLFAIDDNTTSASERWRFNLGSWAGSNFSDRYSVTPAIGPDGTIYAGSQSAALYAVNPDGTQKWKYDTVDGVNASPAIDSNGNIYCFDVYGNAFCLSPTGTELWAEYFDDLSPDGTSTTSHPCIGQDGILYFAASAATVFAVGPDLP